jgi:hypothetical protein
MKWTSRTEGGEFVTEYFPPRVELGLNGQPLPTEAELKAQDEWLREHWIAGSWGDDCVKGDHINCQYDLADERLCECRCHEESWAKLRATQS